MRPDEGEVLLVDKPAGWTSFDVVNKLRRAYGGLKMGHAGTLDPGATGLLILCTGRKRKDIDSFMGLEKEYAAEMRLGIRTPSFDMETEVTEASGIDGISEEQVLRVMGEFVGAVQQVPPMWSAVKVGGKRLYTLARKGMEVERPSREVQIVSIQPGRMDLPDVAFSVVCSKGTYIRTLVHDIGERLGCGATMTALRRTRIGPYRVEDAQSVPQHVERALALRTA
ncbi:MAG: tRNA pseudouridine(55) synthase TruB [Bacteroidetes bacterium]|nr:tRNA pseudouridine(55) synthase TruB [Bacteroidota bacterium]